MTAPKDSHSQFIDEFKQKLEAARFELESRGINLDAPDIAQLIDEIGAYGRDHRDDDFIRSFWNENRVVIGDIYQTSAHAAAKNPFRLSLSYKGVDLSITNLGTDIYTHNVYAPFDHFGRSVADNFLLSSMAALRYLEGDAKAREALLAYFDFQNHRSWHIVWAKTDWVRLAFPKTYERMMKDGEFLSVEELDAKRKEVASTP